MDKKKNSKKSKDVPAETAVNEVRKSARTRPTKDNKINAKESKKQKEDKTNDVLEAVDSTENKEPIVKKGKKNVKKTDPKPNKRTKKETLIEVKDEDTHNDDIKPKKQSKRQNAKESKDEDVSEVKTSKKNETEPKRSAKKEAAKKIKEQEEPVTEAESKKEKPNRRKKKDDTKESIDEEVKTEKKSDVKPKKRSKKENSTESKEDEPEVKKNKKNDKKSDKKETKNKTSSSWSEIEFNTDKKNAKGLEYNYKITSWNVDGLRAWLKKDGLEILKYDNPDILALQETKCTDEDLPDEIKNVQNYHQYWCSSKKKGYAGVGVLSKKMPIEVKYGIEDEEQDEDGRCIAAEYEKFILICVYVPNAGRGLVTLQKRLAWNTQFKKYVKSLEERKPVIICGDMNVAHTEIDLTNPKTNKKNAGFTVEEREGMSDFLDAGFIDTFRMLYPDKIGAYTFWSYMSNARTKNIGWRLDYFLISKILETYICDTVILEKIYGSDHCPITLYINI